MSTYFRRLMVAALAAAVLGVTACDDGTDPVATATVEITVVRATQGDW